MIDPVPPSLPRMLSTSWPHQVQRWTAVRGVSRGSLEAPTGQRVNITILNFNSTIKRPTGLVHPAGKPVCDGLGYLIEKNPRRNTTICSNELKRKENVYLSESNVVEIVFIERQSYLKKLMIRFEGLCTFWVFLKQSSRLMYTTFYLFIRSNYS